MKKTLWTVFAVGAACLLGSTSSFAATTFTQISETGIATVGTRTGDPVQFSTFRADVVSMEAQLALAPLARSNSSLAPVQMELPMPDGTQKMFRVLESPIMAAELGAKYPELKTYEAHGVDDTSAFARFSVTPKGLHAVVYSNGATVWIDPYQDKDTDHYVSYFSHDYQRADEYSQDTWSCGFEDDPVRSEEIATLVAEAAQRGGTSTGENLRTYQLVCAATGEYTSFHGGTVAAGMNAIVVAMNRVNGIYQRELSILMELVPNNDLLVFTNSATDPYTNNNGGAMLSQNQSRCDAVIGSANYDIGHVFSTGGGGIAGLAVICRSGQKARGVTGLPSPINDGFYVDYVAHEMGHQFAANHTFNGTAGSCAGGNRSSGNAYEPGSGSTIMAYAGICSSHNIQFFSDDYFHVNSFNAIRAYTDGPTGGGCATVTATGNNPPVSDADIGGSYTIPINTPFEITGSATDADGDELTYCWEQYNLGPGGHPNFPVGSAPIFRSFLPKDTPTRIFPKITDILNATQTKGEILPSYTRGLTFRLTARDNLGGVSWNSTALSVDDSGGPFIVTGPNSGGIEWPAGSGQTVTWDVAGTNVGVIGAANVDIFLSEDGGMTFPHMIASSVPNDGSQVVSVPSIPETSTARIKVKASDNVFFDISNFNFTVTADIAGIGDDDVREDGVLFGASPNPFQHATHVSFRTTSEEQVSLRVYSASGRVLSTLADDVLPAGEHTRIWDGTDADGRQMPSGVYFYRLELAGKVLSKQIVLTD